MGNCVGMTPEEREARHRNAAIEKQLRTDARDFENTIKILLLGKPEGTNLPATPRRRKGKRVCPVTLVIDFLCVCVAGPNLPTLL